jgi:hypothetical protein
MPRHSSKPSHRLASNAKRCAGTQQNACSNIGYVRIAGIWYCRACLAINTDQVKEP